MLDEAIRLYETGMTQKEVGLKLGTTQKVIWGMFRNSGYKSRIAKKRNQTGEHNDSWRGSEATYKAFHVRVGVLRGKPSLCSMCDNDKAKRYEWANVSGRYENVYDYIRLCKSCHSIFDKCEDNFNKRKGGDAQ